MIHIISCITGVCLICIMMIHNVMEVDYCYYCCKNRLKNVVESFSKRPLSKLYNNHNYNDYELV